MAGEPSGIRGMPRSPFQGLHSFFLAPRALPWADMGKAVGLQARCLLCVTVVLVPKQSLGNERSPCSSSCSLCPQADGLLNSLPPSPQANGLPMSAQGNALGYEKKKIGKP